MRRARVMGAVPLVLVLSATVGPARMASAARYALPSHVSAHHIMWGKPIFFDTFNRKKLDPPTSHNWWVYVDPRGRNPRTRDSVRLYGGSLNLVGHYQRPYGYVSGGVAYAHNQTYGRWVVRFRADAGAGYEPVALLWPKGKWPDDGEIDMAEIWRPSRLGAGEFLHLGKTNRFIGHPIPRSVNFTKWQTLAVDWLPGHITFWIDGRKLWTVRRGKGANSYIPSTPFHLALQNDAGCATGKCEPNKGTPKRVVMQIAWVKIYAAPAGG
jgi:hypothetical protein